MLKAIRIALAAFFFTGITWLFLDVTETAQHLLGWMARIQFLPAVLALSIGIVGLLILLTLLFGRIYCSTLCPLGVFQDIAAWLGTHRKKNRYHFSKARNPLRYGALAAFIVLTALGVHSLALLLAPYSGYGRIVQNLFSPLYRAGNNLLAFFAKRADSYAFSPSDIFIGSWPTFVVTLIFFTAIAFLAVRHGRLWCNTLCPVGTVLGFLARFSWFKPVLDSGKCVNCHACEQRCKASCIDIETHSVDASRCVACMNCIGSCPQGAIHYGHSRQKDKNEQMNENVTEPLSTFTVTRRSLLLALATVLSATIPANAAQNAEGNRTDGGLAELKPRKTPKRIWPLRPPGAHSQKNFRTRCTACQLCVAACPNGVLCPSSAPLDFMQPEMNFERGFCRPECRRCSEVCPTGAIQSIGDEEKSAIHIGKAIWEKSLCLPANGGDSCNNCERHCPNGSISLIDYTATNGQKVQVPAVDTERCTGCGACEYVCPARPLSAIHVTGYEVHRIN